MAKPPGYSTKHTRLYRQRRRAAGEAEVLLQFPCETLAYIDDLKRRLGLRNRSQVLLQLIGKGRAATQTMT